MTVMLHRYVPDASKDRYGNRNPGFTDLPAPGVLVWPEGSSETDQAQDVTTTALTSWWPPQYSVTARDEVTVNGIRYRVDGDPFTWSSPWSAVTPGTEVHLRRAR